jgi:hypothetical protein
MSKLKSKMLVIASYSKVPKEPGLTPIPKGSMRRFHVTHPKNVESIYSWPDKEGAKQYAGGHGVIVEFHHDPKHYNAHPYATHEPVHPSHIVAIHHPWHEQYRYIKENKVPMKNVEKLKDDPHYKESYTQLKHEKYQ